MKQDPSFLQPRCGARPAAAFARTTAAALAARHATDVEIAVLRQIMDRDALLKNLRGVTYDGMDRSVDVAISRLRKKLLDNATEPYRIKTVRNKGYLFAPHAWDN